jgi:hypothetical protein
MAVLQEPLQEVFQGPRARRLAAPLLVNVANHVLQYLAGARESHFGIDFGDLHGLSHPFSKFPEIIGYAVEEGKH